MGERHGEFDEVVADDSDLFLKMRTRTSTVFQIQNPEIMTSSIVFVFEQKN
jgi:hypothetical protein